jgi:nucleotide-binding universal stress UspA family protein
MYQHLLVPTDGSSLSQQAASAAIAFAHACGSRIHVLSVAEPVAGAVLTDGALVFDAGSAADELAAAAHARVRQVAAQAAAAGVPCEVGVTVSNDPAGAILRAAQAHGCDAIFLGSHGRRGWSRLIAGSEALKVIEGARVPVIVFRPPQDAPL